MIATIVSIYGFTNDSSDAKGGRMSMKTRPYTSKLLKVLTRPRKSLNLEQYFQVSMNVLLQP